MDNLQDLADAINSLTPDEKEQLRTLIIHTDDDGDPLNPPHHPPVPPAGK